MPAALERKPELSSYEGRMLQHYAVLVEMCQEGFSGRSAVSLKEIDVYLSYYPVSDVYYFIDMMREIDRCCRERRNKSNSKN